MQTNASNAVTGRWEQLSFADNSRRHRNRLAATTSTQTRLRSSSSIETLRRVDHPAVAMILKNSVLAR